MHGAPISKDVAGYQSIDGRVHSLKWSADDLYPASCTLNPVDGTIPRMRAADLVLSARRKHHGWMVVGVLFMASALAIGSSNYAFGLFIEPLETTFGWQRTAISASLSFMAVSSMTAPIIGRMMDRYGARTIMTVSLTIYGLSYLLRPAMHVLWHWYALSFLQFVAFSGVAGLPAGRLVVVWFPNRPGRVMGITMMGNNFGGLTMPIVAGYALAVASWETAFLVYAAIAFSLAFLALVVIRDPPDDAGSDGTQLPGGHRAAQAVLGDRDGP